MKIKNKVSLIVATALMGIIGGLLFGPISVHAAVPTPDPASSTGASPAPPGCYTQMPQSGGGGFQPAGSDCTGQKGYDPSKCYVSQFGSTTFTEMDCALVNPILQVTPVGVDTGTNNPGLETCGSGNQAVHISIHIGCTGKNANPIFDALFAILRFLSYGVGVVLIASTIIVGIQYSFARGDPGTTKQAKERLVYIVVALLIYIFSFAILNFLVPGGLLQ